MGFWKWLDAKARRLGALDMGLVKVSVFFFALMVAKLYSPALSLDWQYYAAIFLLAGILPTLRVFGKR